MNTVQDISSKETQTNESNSRTADKFVVRLPKGMRQMIAEVAKNYHRSMNSEIVSRLESSLRVEPCLFTGEGADTEGSSLSENDSLTYELNKTEVGIIERIRLMDNTTKEAFITLLSNLNTPA